MARKRTVRFHDMGGGPVLRWRAGRVLGILTAVVVIATTGALALFPDLPRGDRTMVNVDLVLYDADGRLILQDQVANRQPGIRYAPESTDTFYLVVHATERVRGADEKGAVALGVTYRQVPAPWR